MSQMNMKVDPFSFKRRKEKNPTIWMVAKRGFIEGKTHDLSPVCVPEANLVRWALEAVHAW